MSMGGGEGGQLIVPNSQTGYGVHVDCAIVPATGMNLLYILSVVCLH